jgi:hypothetical protein
MPAPQATTSIATWNRATKHVEADMRSGRYVNAETALVFVGPPRLTDIGGLDLNLTLSTQNAALTGNGNNALYPVGLLEQVGFQQVQNVQKMYEIGARRSYQAGGRVQVVGSIGRVLFNGPSLLRVLMAYYPNAVAMANGKTLGPGGQADSVSASMLTQGTGLLDVFPPIYLAAGSFAAPDPEVANGLPFSFFVNLMSELFAQPFGIGVILRDNRNRNYGAFYAEDTMVTSHSLAINSSSTLITEAVNFQSDCLIPMEFSTQSGAVIASLGSTA